MTYHEMYAEAVRDAERHAAKKAQRMIDLEHYYRKTVHDAISVGALIDRDQIVQEHQLLHERAVARAAMYGPGAILEALAQG